MARQTVDSVAPEHQLRAACVTHGSIARARLEWRPPVLGRSLAAYPSTGDMSDTILDLRDSANGKVSQNNLRDESVFLALLAETALERGELFRAAGLALHAIEREAALPDTRLVAPYYVWGTVLVERHELLGATAALELAVERAADVDCPWCRVLTRISLANALHGSGDVDRAHWTLRDARRHDDHLPASLEQRIVETKAWFALLEDDELGARDSISQLDEPARSQMQAHVKAESGDMQGALAALDNVAPTTTFDHIDALLLRARCSQDVDEQVHLIRAAVSAAEPDAYVRPFLNCDPWLRPMLARIASGWPSAFAARLLKVLDEAAAPISLAPDVNGLTPREREVLGYLGTRLSIADIARRLYISDNTAKSHVRSIYQKLGVRSRLEADAWQRQLMA